MKKYLFYAYLILYGLTANAQQTCGERAIANFFSDNWSNYQPAFAISGYFRFADSIQLVGSPVMDSSSWFTFIGFTAPSISTPFHNDSLIFQFYLSADTANTSYYPQEVYFKQKYVNIQTPDDTLKVAFTVDYHGKLLYVF